MIIEKVFINTFGGLTKRNIDLAKGMNVIVGPNESGKSTIYSAIENALFTPSNLSPARFKKQMGCFLPISGGDTIEVEVHFKRKAKKYKLQRRWGASVSSALTLPDGSILSEDDSIQKVIRECIQVTEGTHRTVMMTYQSGLSKTVNDIQADREILESLGDILRKTVMEMDGVSVDAFKARVEESLSGFFGRWDIDADYPEGNRGVENPWVKGIGSVTQLFYEKEKEKKDLEDAVHYERELDELNKTILAHESNLDKAESFIRKYKEVRKDSVERKGIGAELRRLELEYEKLETINRDWPVVESKAGEDSQKIPQLEEKEKELNKDKQEAEIYQKSKALLDQLGRVEKKKLDVDKAMERLQKVKKIPDEDLKLLRKAVNRQAQIEAALSAARLSGKFQAKKDIEIEIQKTLADRVSTSIKAGKSVDFQADGRLLISHSEWDLEVISAEIDYGKTVKQHEKAKSSVEDLLRKLEIAALEEAEAANAAYNAELASLKTAEGILQDELGDFTVEELREKVKGIQAKKPEKELKAIYDDLTDLRAEIKVLKSELAKHQEKLHGYAGEYGDRHKLLEKVAEVAGLKKEQQKILGKLKPLPAEIKDVDKFISMYDEKESQYKDVKEEHDRCIQDRIRLESSAPDRSVEEIEKDVSQAEDLFIAEHRAGMALARIKQKMDSLLEEMDSATYSGLEKDVSGLLQKLTGGRYKSAVMEEAVPNGFSRKDGVVMPYDRLSAGMKDVLGIALRIALINQFLKKKESFIIMDDPLVDLDPGRQSKAAKILQDFAKNKQLILLTCHPSHADLFSGNRIELSL